MECRGSARLPGTQIASTLAPTNHCCFDGVACIHALPSAAPPSTQERNNIRADVILAKELKRLVGRRYAFVNEGIDSLLPCRHAVLIIRAGGGFDASRSAAAAARHAYIPIYDTARYGTTSEDRMAFKPNYGRDRAERARAARVKSEEKQRKKDEKAALRKAERGETEPPPDETSKADA
jgi:hypothetical protein